jgi:hypothetical protein
MFSRHTRQCSTSIGCAIPRFQDEVGNLVGMRDQRKMARLHFDSLDAHALGHEAFEIRIDRPVFYRNGIEARFRSRGRMMQP